MTTEFHTSVISVVEMLASFSSKAAGLEHRDCCTKLNNYLYNEDREHVCLLFGLYGTGKATLIKQVLYNMSKDNLNKAAYIKIRKADDIAKLNKDIQKLYDMGIRFLFVDEVTLMDDFIDSAALFSDVYAPLGMKIVLSGTDSLGFWFAMDQELYDRAIAINTTYIPFHEYSRLLKINDIDEYIRYGGTLKAGELAFEDKDANAPDASFRDEESTRRYIDTAICRNIQHSLQCYDNGNHFRHLYQLYEAGELTNAINRIIEDMNHRFLISVLTKDFVSHDLGISATNLRKARNANERLELLDMIDIETVTKKLMELLDIRNKENMSIGITNTHFSEIKEYLTALELIEDCPVETIHINAASNQYTLFTQPGMRYCQAQALVYSLLRDPVFQSHSEREKQLVCNRILEEVKGRMMEDIVLLETKKALRVSAPYQRVFKLQFAVGEYDMVIYDSKENFCNIYEIKHSEQSTPEQYRHLIDSTKCEQTEHKYGEIRNRYVIYRGENKQIDNINFLNVEYYLLQLPHHRKATEPNTLQIQ